MDNCVNLTGIFPGTGSRDNAILHGQEVRTKGLKGHVILNQTRCHAIAKITARCAQYMSALKIVCKHKSSRRLRKNLHITILELFGGEIIFELFQQM